MKYFIFLLTFTTLIACNGTKQNISENMSCNTKGTVKDYAGLDGCGLLIELEDGKRLEPAEVADDFELKDGQQIAFDYEIMPEMASICMAGKIVRITCIKEI
ncbi:MAG: hypothetical protein AAGI23_01990 [Bacteroidota bacterium]